MEEKLNQLIQQFLENENKAHDYYDKQRIDFDSMLKMKKENAENFEKFLSEFNKFAEMLSKDCNQCCLQTEKGD